LALCSLASSTAFLARFSAIFSRRSSSFCFFSSSVRGLIYTAMEVKISTVMHRSSLTHLFRRFFELIMSALLSVEICQGSVLEDFTAHGAFDTLGEGYYWRVKRFHIIERKHTLASTALP
jgi:hypothetical protein